MQLEAQEFLRIVEDGGNLMFWDTESQGRDGDYGRMYVVSAKSYGRETQTLSIGKNACDKGLVREAKELLDTADAWVTFYGKGHDVPLMNTRLLRWGYQPLLYKPHIDMYFQIKYKIKTGSKSQAHLLEFLQDTMTLMGVPKQQKMTVSPNVWSDLFTNFNRNIKILRERCASDAEGLESLYQVTKHLIRDIRR